GGPHTFTLTARNGIGAPATQRFVLRVTEAPAITSPAKLVLTAGTAAHFTVKATGFPAAHFTATVLPSWAKLNATTGALTGTPTPAGTFHATVSAANGITPAAQHTLTITVAPAPALPTTTKVSVSGPAVSRKPLTLTATVGAHAGIPAGSITFVIDGK